MAKQRPVLAAVLAAAFVAAALSSRIRARIYTWGATPAEVAAQLPGDDLLTPGRRRTTRAVTVDAPIGSVWPWLVQLGEDRGGFYSHDLLERAVGADIHNADTIHPEWQHLHVGDTVWLARRYGSLGSQIVAAVQPGEYLVLVSPDDYSRIERGGAADGSWAFYLQPRGQRTRLIARGSGGAVGRIAFDVVHFIMEWQMLRGIRRRGERLWSGSSSDVVPIRADSLPLTSRTP